MIVIRFKVQCRPDRIEEALAAFAAVVPPSREIDGVVSFDIGRDVIDTNAIIVTEVFEDAAAREHQESLPEVAHVMDVMPDLLAAPPEATVFEVAAASDAFASA
jgi:quinol monooxygenase YgiN